jgi:glycosyltransferase involved in cell wall biosynthesis
LIVVMARLVLLTPAELSRDPRARRAAAAAVADGWSVAGVCPRIGGDPVALDRVEVFRTGGDAIDRSLRSAGLGGGRPDNALLRELRGVYRLVRLARLTLALVRTAHRVGSADVVHAHDFDTLPAGTVIARRTSARLVYDAHELYTLQEADPPRLHRFVMRLLESRLAQRADAVITVSDPIAVELRRVLGLDAQPLVVLNCPPRTNEAADPATHAPLKAIYQGAVGLGRSLDDLLDAAETMTRSVQLTLRLVSQDLRALQREVERRGLADRVQVLAPVDPDELVAALTDYDIGVVATRPLTRNDALAVPNKLFEYLMAGLAVVVPDTPGVADVVRETGAGETFTAGSPQALAQVLDRLALEPEEVTARKRRARAAALERYNAEAQRPSLVKAWAG